jgi:hypothetical protein
MVKCAATEVIDGRRISDPGRAFASPGTAR